jgi:hypothetical protein
MKIIVTHTSPDMDAITSAWLIKRFLDSWEDATIYFVAAGERIDGGKYFDSSNMDPIEKIEENEVIHVDTGLGPLDHHQTISDQVCASSLVWDFIKKESSEFSTKQNESEKMKDRKEALSRLVKVVTDVDHFKEVFRENPLADYHEFDLVNILDGLKVQFPNSDEAYVEFIFKALDAILHQFDNRIWAEKEIAKTGVKFETGKGPGIGFETINDSVIKLSQKMGYVVAVRRDPRKGYVRIKAIPTTEKINIDLTPVYEELRKIDSGATWFLHVSKKMLLNGSTKNPKMRPSSLTLDEIIKVLKKI